MPNAHAPSADGIYISTLASTVCCILDFTIEIFQISVCQERASSKRFPLCLCQGQRAEAIIADPPALPVTGLLRCGLRPQNYEKKLKLTRFGLKTGWNSVPVLNFVGMVEGGKDGRRGMVYFREVQKNLDLS